MNNNLKLSNLTIIILNWKRKENVLRLIETYKEISKIIIVNNNPESIIESKDVIIVNSSEDLGLFSRFAIATLVDTDAVAFVDDDLELPFESLEFLYKKWEQEPDVLHSMVGRGIVDGNYAKVPVYGQCPIVLTRAMITTPQMCALTLAHAKDFNKEVGGEPVGNGEDILISFVATFLSNKPNKAYQIAVTELPADHSIFKRVSNHYPHRTNVVKWCLERFKS
jgi:hypothetical protein